MRSDSSDDRREAHSYITAEEVSEHKGHRTQSPHTFGHYSSSDRTFSRLFAIVVIAVMNEMKIRAKLSDN